MTHGLLNDLKFNRSLNELILKDLDQFPDSSSISAARKFAMEAA